MNSAGSTPDFVSEAIRKRCVYCLRNNHLRTDQILVCGKYLYLCAPRGQLTEGFLVIAPHSCIGCLSRLPDEYFLELTRIKTIVADFYREVYGVEQGTFYEQGRAGGDAVLDEIAGFPHHAHLCCLPVSLDLHTPLSRQYVQLCLSGSESLPTVIRDSPYLFVEGLQGEAGCKVCVYLAQTDKGRLDLERKRLKPMIAALMGLPLRGDWRAYPGDRELERLIRMFSHFWHSRRST